MKFGARLQIGSPHFLVGKGCIAIKATDELPTYDARISMYEITSEPRSVPAAMIREECRPNVCLLKLGCVTDDIVVSHALSAHSFSGCLLLVATCGLGNDGSSAPLVVKFPSHEK